MHAIESFLLGQAPWKFLLEVAYRSVIIYVVLLACMRVLGKRMAAKLEIAELAVILLLGAAISAPMQVPTQGMLPAVIVLATVAGLQRGLSLLSYGSRRAQKMVFGQADLLVCDGHFVIERMRANNLSRDMLLSELRARGIRQLGEVRRVYIEATGTLSVIRFKEPVAGLSLAPIEDDDAWFDHSQDNECVCWNCGHRIDVDKVERACPNCGGHRRRQAVK